MIHLPGIYTLFIIHHFGFNWLTAKMFVHIILTIVNMTRLLRCLKSVKISLRYFRRNEMDQNSNNNNQSSGNYRPRKHNNRRRKPRPYNPDNASVRSSGNAAAPSNAKPRQQQPQQQQQHQNQQQNQQHQPQQQQQQQQQRKLPASNEQRPVYNKLNRPNRPQNRWDDRKVKIEETFEDVRKDNERIEKEIWLEIAEIHNLRLD